MKKRAMKKYIPKNTPYCYDFINGEFKNCKWRKYITTIELNKANCEHKETCNELCWTTNKNSCRVRVYKCEYMNYVDWKEDSLLWDSCKECGVSIDFI